MWVDPALVVQHQTLLPQLGPQSGVMTACLNLSQHPAIPKQAADPAEMLAVR